jgi:hypothetical protein
MAAERPLDLDPKHADALHDHDPDPQDPPDEPIPDTLRMTTPEDDARAILVDLVGGLGRREIWVLTRIAEHLSRGRRDHDAPCCAAGAVEGPLEGEEVVR